MNTSTVINPATEDVLRDVELLDIDAVDDAVARAVAAQRRWARLAPAERAGALRAFAAVVDAHIGELAALEVANSGHPIGQAEWEAGHVRDVLTYYAASPERLTGQQIPVAGGIDITFNEPLGVVGIITPWNFPFCIPAWKIAPALVAGNTVVFKPSSDTPHCATLLVELMDQAGFPAGTVNLVTGAGGEVGDAIVDNPDVSVISFTGSSATGKGIAVRAGAKLKRLSLELGGKNAIVVLADADLELATDGIVWSAFGTTGQRCTAASRVIVERSVVGPLLERLEARASRLRLGSGLDAAVDVGPLINAGAVEKVGRYVGIGRNEGELVLGGEAARAGELAHGHFFAPTIFRDVAPMDRIAQEEIFGPVLSVIAVDDYAAAATAVNQTRYGLSSSIFTRDANAAFRAMRDFETGIVYVNAGTTGAETHLPFGGWKETGNGHREAGHAALDTYTEWKSIYVDFSGRLQRAQIDNQA